MKTDNKILTIPDFMFVLRVIDDNPTLCISDLHERTKMTYSHLHYMKKMFVEKGWATISIEGKAKKHIPVLTEQGKAVSKNIELLLESMGIGMIDLWELKAKSKRKKDVPDVQQDS